MKTYPLVLSLFFMVTSWILGFYFISILYTPVIIIPLFNDFLWVSEYKGLLGLTAIVTILTLALNTFLLKKQEWFTKKRSWYSLSILNHVFWLATIASQLKIVAYNLGICH